MVECFRVCGIYAAVCIYVLGGSKGFYFKSDMPHYTTHYRYTIDDIEFHNLTTASALVVVSKLPTPSISNSSSHQRHTAAGEWPNPQLQSTYCITKFQRSAVGERALSRARTNWHLASNT